MGETKELAKKKKFKMPHTLVIIFIIILAAVLFTWIVPSGEYVQIEDPVTGRELIDPNSFHFVENTPVNPLRIMNYIIDGFMDAADLIFMLMFAGGAFHLITESGALQASIAKVARKFSNRFYIFIPMLTLIFTLIATNQGVNLFIPFVPITVMLSFALGLDSLVGVSIILLGGAVGFSTGTLDQHHPAGPGNRRSGPLLRHLVPGHLPGGFLGDHQHFPDPLCHADQEKPAAQPHV